MVRINLINPKYLADQHLIAEYLEIQMLVGYVKKHPKTSIDKIPKEYTLAKGHMLFFKNKVRYLQKRHELIIKEMKKRGFKVNKKLNIKGITKELIKDWKPNSKDKEIIKKRIIWKINKKPNFYRYYKENKSKKFLIDLIKNAR